MTAAPRTGLRAEAEAAARASRGAMRDQIAATAGMEVVEFGVWEVAVYEVAASSDGDS